MIPRCFAVLPLSVLLASGTVGATAPELVLYCDPVPAPEQLLSAADVQKEADYCDIDLGREDVAICPKTWSTSPGAVIYDLAGTEWQGRVMDFEREHCGPGGKARELAAGELALFKNSLNGQETSGTFSPAAVLYYHFSRVLETRVQVPVAARVAFELGPYRQRVIEPGLAFSDSASRKMLHAGWQEMAKAAAEPAVYGHRRELFSGDLQRLWGVLLESEGRRYGPELNGTRASGWGDGQNRDFQRTAPFIALRSELPLGQAISRAVAEARSDDKMASALPADIAPAQVASWMHDITEIVILDYVLKQQDRIGNVDYLSRWHWLEEGKLKQGATRPDGFNAVKLKVSVLNDNDAGVRSGYANYASRTGMLSGWRHLSPRLYRRVQALGLDFEQNGPLAASVRSRYRLSAREAQGIIDRGREAAALLRKACLAGQLRFDLTDAALLAPANADHQPVSCSADADASQAVSASISAE